MLIYKEGSSEFLSKCLDEIPQKVHIASVKASISNAIHGLEVLHDMDVMYCNATFAVEISMFISNLADTLEDVDASFPD